MLLKANQIQRADQAVRIYSRSGIVATVVCATFMWNWAFLTKALPSLPLNISLYEIDHSHRLPNGHLLFFFVGGMELGGRSASASCAVASSVELSTTTPVRLKYSLLVFAARGTKRKHNYI